MLEGNLKALHGTTGDGGKDVVTRMWLLFEQKSFVFCFENQLITYRKMAILPFCANVPSTAMQFCMYFIALPWVTFVPSHSLHPRLISCRPHGAELQGSAGLDSRRLQSLERGASYRTLRVATGAWVRLKLFRTPCDFASRH